MTVIYYPNIGVFMAMKKISSTSYVFHPISTSTDETSLEDMCKVFKILIKKTHEIYHDVRPKKNVAADKIRTISLESIMEACNFYQIRISDLLIK